MGERKLHEGVVTAECCCSNWRIIETVIKKILWQVGSQKYDELCRGVARGKYTLEPLATKGG